MPDLSPKQRPLDEPDPLADFEGRQVTIDGVTRRVYVAGLGPAVIVLPEMPGISPHVARFARWVRDAGFTAYMPSLFGRDGDLPNAADAVRIFQRACVSAEFRTLAGGGASPATQWLRGLAKRAHASCGGPGVGAVGMCFTGNFALSMMLEPAMLAAVLCQPVLPMDDPAGIEMSPQELAAVRRRMDEEDLTVMAYRFEGDRFCSGQRFAAYAEALGTRFIGRVLPDSAARRDGLPPFFKQVVVGPHSVVTVHLIDEAGQPTVAARDEILGFLARQLGH